MNLAFQLRVCRFSSLSQSSVSLQNWSLLQQLGFPQPWPPHPFYMWSVPCLLLRDDLKMRAWWGRESKSQCRQAHCRRPWALRGKGREKGHHNVTSERSTGAVDIVAAVPTSFPLTPRCVAAVTVPQPSHRNGFESIWIKNCGVSACCWVWCFFWGVLRLTVMMAVQLCEYTKYTVGLYTLNEWIMWHANDMSIKMVLKNKTKEPVCIPPATKLFQGRKCSGLLLGILGYRQFALVVGENETSSRS